MRENCCGEGGGSVEPRVCDDCPGPGTWKPTARLEELTPDKYSELALRTSPGMDFRQTQPDDDELVTITKRQYRLLLGAIGLCGEAGEVAEMVKKHVFHEHPLDVPKLRKELGDVAWYHNYLTVRSAFTTLGHIFWLNIEKLKARYPEGFFSSARSLNRREGDN